MQTQHPRALAVCAAAPFLVAACLFVLMILSPVTGMRGPSSNTFFAVGAVAIIVGFCVGVVSLVKMRKRIWVRCLMGLLYFPVVLFSLLSVGA